MLALLIRKKCLMRPFLISINNFFQASGILQFFTSLQTMESLKAVIFGIPTKKNICIQAIVQWVEYSDQFLQARSSVGSSHGVKDYSMPWLTPSRMKLLICMPWLTPPSMNQVSLSKQVMVEQVIATVITSYGVLGLGGRMFKNLNTKSRSRQT